MGQEPIVVDSADIRRDPEGMLKKLCDALELEWDPAMLSWPEGGHKDDGVWASHWYGAVHKSAGFAGAEGDLPELSGEAGQLADQAMAHYQKLAMHKI